MVVFNEIRLAFIMAFFFSCSGDVEDKHFISLGLPVMIINTKGGTVIEDKEDYIDMDFELIDYENPSNNVSGSYFKGRIKGRGNTTWLQPKKPYRIKFGKKASLFGLPAAESWVLLAEYFDPTFLINSTAFNLGDIFAMPFNHSWHYVHLYLNNKYNGLYILTEHNEVGKGRVDIDEYDGWFIEMDNLYDEEPKFRTTNYDLPVMIKSPEGHPNYDFVKKDINELCDSLASTGFPENGYRNLIDIDGFIDYLMVNEIVMNGELWHPKSAFLYKDKNGKISTGPLWDFDMAFSNSQDWENYIHSYFTSFSGYSGKHAFFERFFEDPVFLEKYKARWDEKYIELYRVPTFIEKLGAKIKPSVEKDYEKWKSHYNYSLNYDKQITDMKLWFNSRLEWLNGYPQPPQRRPVKK